LFQANTVSQLAALIEKQGETQGEDWPILIPVQTRGTRGPLFCVARPNVNALGYLMLSRELGIDQPVYGLQVQLEEDPAIDFSDEQYRTTAAEYIRAIRAVQPHGPYNMIGQCQGAYIAFEMVRQLEAEGERVSFLGILDAWTEENTRHRWRFMVYLAMRRLEGLKSRILKKTEDQAQSQPTAPKTQGHPAKSQEPGSSYSKKALFQKYFPGKGFVPPVCSVPITVFRLGKQPWYRKNDATMGWGDRTRLDVKTRNISGHHLTIMRQPFVKELASMVAERLNETERGNEKAS
jgi:thioesterase domain-containing protein